MATVVGIIQKPDLTPFSGTVKFTAISTPMAYATGTSIVVGSTVEVDTDEDDGSFTVNLACGRYRVKANAQWFLIDVPDGGDQYDIRQLVSGGVWGATTPLGFTVATPTASPDGGEFAGSVEITLACSTPGASIRYTTDGSTPSSTDGTLYEAPFSLSDTTTVKFIAFKDGATSSAVVTKTFTEVDPVYYGTSEDAILDESGIEALESSRASTTEAGTYEFTVAASPEKYLYFAWPNSFGSPAATTGFSAFGFPLGMASGGDFSNVQNGWYYALVTVGGTSYRLYRTEYKQGMDYTVTVS